MCRTCEHSRGTQGSSGAEGAVDPPCEVGHSPLLDEPLQERCLLLDIVGLLLLHHPGGEAVVVVQRRPLQGEVVAKAGQADLVTEQAG